MSKEALRPNVTNRWGVSPLNNPSSLRGGAEEIEIGVITRCVISELPRCKLVCLVSLRILTYVDLCGYVDLCDYVDLCGFMWIYVITWIYVIMIMFGSCAAFRFETPHTFELFRTRVKKLVLSVVITGQFARVFCF